jgi:ubiquinone/menaquinone biosynthesis C-methylase UbiE
VPAAPLDAWRSYDEQAPIPNYFDFDWLSSRHPDLYHKFALSTLGLMHELDRLVDLSGLDVLEAAAGTGRAAIEAGRKAHRVTAIDIFPSVVCFGKEMVRQAGLGNVDYARADCNICHSRRL